MKLKLIPALIGAVLALTACNKEAEITTNPDPDNGTKSVYLQIDGLSVGSKSRSIEPTAHDTAAELYSAALYFLDIDGKVYHVHTMGENKEFEIADLVEGIKIDNVSDKVKTIYIVGNYDGTDENDRELGLPLASGIHISTVKETVLNIQTIVYPAISKTNTGTKLLTLLDGEGDVKEFSSSATNDWINSNTGIHPNDGDYYASITIAPVNARLEIKKMEYTGNLLKSFDLEAIYVNNFYSHRKLDFTGGTVMNNGSDHGKYDPNDADFAYSGYSKMYDILSQRVGISNSNEIFPSGTANVWAYNVFGNHREVPHIVIKFTNLERVDGLSVGDRYLTVKGYSNEQGVSLESLAAGRLYIINNLKFGDNDLTIDPEPENINVYVQVRVAKWETEYITPEL